jgi:NADPH:quinone reductase-like Zn-dependent oxidoreductase
MQAVVQQAYGTADELEVRDVAVPAVGDDEVLIDVRAAGVDRGVVHLMTGLPYLIRLAGYGLRAPKSPVPGMDVSGVVLAVGRNVTRFSVDDEVLGIGRGTFAEVAVAEQGKLVHKPADLSFPEAAALAVSGLAALQAVRDHAKVRPGENVLVLGASGGVGSYAVQIAKSLGAHVTGVSSAAKAALVAELGADEVLDYARTDFASTGRRYDAIIDIGGNSSLSRLRRALAPHGRLVITGGENGGRWIGGTDRQLRAMALSPFVSQSLRTFIASDNVDDLAALVEMVERGSITPKVDRTYPLGEAPDAVQYVAEGRARGKVVLLPAETA